MPVLRNGRLLFRLHVLGHGCNVPFFLPLIKAIRCEVAMAFLVLCAEHGPLPRNTLRIIVVTIGILTLALLETFANFQFCAVN